MTKRDKSSAEEMGKSIGKGRVSVAAEEESVKREVGKEVVE